MVRHDLEVEDGDDDDCRARLLALFVIIGTAGVLAGMALAQLMDWMHR